MILKISTAADDAEMRQMAYFFFQGATLENSFRVDIIKRSFDFRNLQN